MAGATATRSRRRQAAHADQERPNSHVMGRANKHHHHQDAPQSKPRSTDSAKSKAEQEYMERLAKEFSSLPDRELPQGESSGTSQISTTPRPNTNSTSSVNAAITKTIRSAIADMKKRS